MRRKVFIGLVLELSVLPALAGVPTQINHQGVVSVNGQRFNGNGSFYFAIIDPSTGNSVWTNDGTNIGTPDAPDQPVMLSCVNGLYNVRLGDTSLTNMTPVTVGVFSSENRALRIWFDDGTNGVFQLTPDHPLTSVPYAFRAAESGSAGAKFGGTGVDGALSVSSGTTNIDLGGVSVFIKNYTSISTTGTGKLTFSNPHPNGTVIVLKSQGNVTLTSSQSPLIDASGIGGAGGAARTGCGIGNDGTSGITSFRSSAGGKGTTVPQGGTGGSYPPVLDVVTSFFSPVFYQYPFLIIGAGGGSGTHSEFNCNGSSGAGGRGGGVLIIESRGAWNFTTTAGISVAGQNGGDGVPGPDRSASGGGGGGGGGLFVALYNTLAANTGTVTVSGGVGGFSNHNYDAGSSGGGGGGAGAGNAGSSGTARINSNGSEKTGGNGGVGLSLVAQNTQFP